MPQLKVILTAEEQKAVFFALSKATALSCGIQEMCCPSHHSVDLASPLPTH